jgi:hypothetical protein
MGFYSVIIGGAQGKAKREIMHACNYDALPCFFLALAACTLVEAREKFGARSGRGRRKIK